MRDLKNNATSDKFSVLVARGYELSWKKGNFP